MGGEVSDLAGKLAPWMVDQVRQQRAEALEAHAKACERMAKQYTDQAVQVASMDEYKARRGIAAGLELAATMARDMAKEMTP